MDNIFPLFKKELRAYFDSPIAYIVLIIFLLIIGWFFGSNLFLINQAELRTVFQIAPMIFMFLIPAITMRLLAEEKKAGTIELLVTMPIRDFEIVAAKFLASFALLTVGVIMTFVYAFTVAWLGEVDNGPLAGGYIALLLMGAAYISVGLYFSSLTSNQIVAFVATFAFIFGLYIINNALIFFPGSIASILEYISIQYHFDNIIRGVIDTRDLIYYFSIIGLFLFLTNRTLEARA